MSASVGFGVDLQQRHRRHDLAGLAVAALRHVDRDPGLLHRLGLRAGEPSIVITSEPSTLEIGVTQERRVGPSRCTVQAPHWATPQPYLVPVSFSKSRMTHRSGVSGSPSKVFLLSVEGEGDHVGVPHLAPHVGRAGWSLVCPERPGCIEHGRRPARGQDTFLLPEPESTSSSRNNFRKAVGCSGYLQS